MSIFLKTTKRNQTFFLINYSKAELGLLGSTTKQHKASNNAYRMDFALKQQFIARIQTTAV